MKIRPPDARLQGCFEVQQRLWASGFPCAEPLTAPVPLGDRVAHAERLLPGGMPGTRSDAWLTDRTAEELARLITMAPDPESVGPLRPPPAWVGWSDERADPWPPPDEGAALNDHPSTESLRPLARALNERLASVPLTEVIGHADWYQGNLRWGGPTLVAADDWDSIAVLPEAALAGCSAASFLPPWPEEPPDRPGAAVDDTARFLQRYAEVRSLTWSADELEVAWAAGLWQRVFDAAKALVADRPEAAAAQVRDADARRRLAGC